MVLDGHQPTTCTWHKYMAAETAFCWHHDNVLLGLSDLWSCTGGWVVGVAWFAVMCMWVDMQLVSLAE